MRFAGLIREPLVQFLAIGLVLFGISNAISPRKAADPREIVLDQDVYSRLASIFAEKNNRAPTVEEMAPLVDRFLINETLFREAKSLNLDQGDEMIRERLVHRMRLLIYNGINVDPPSEPVLRKWVDANKQRYQSPELLSFKVIALDANEAEARREAENAQTRKIAGEVVKPAGIRMLTFAERPRLQLSQAFETAFVDAVAALEPETWSAVPSSRGWQVVELIKRVPPRAPTFEEIQSTARKDWKHEATQRVARETLDALMASYSVSELPYDRDTVELLFPEAQVNAAGVVSQ